MGALLDRLNGGEIIAIIAVVMGPLIAIVAVIMGHWRKVKIAEIEAALKQQMIDKGMSADEIERVLIATQEPAEKEEKV